MLHYINRFIDSNQIKETAQYYVELLGLQDWRIIYKLTDDFNEDLAGLCETDYTSKTACISIRKTIPDKNLWIKQPHEEVLIHELLHCKFIRISNDTAEGLIYDQFHHTLLDDMARAIFKARYNLTNKDYFKEE